MSSIEKFINKLDKSSSKDGGASALPDDEHFPEYEQGYHEHGGLNQSSLVEINFALLEQQGMLTPNSVNTRLAEEYRAIKRPLLNNAFGKTAQDIPHGNLIMVSSAMPGEGKSFSAINLAMSMASELDRTVLLVEADVAKPAVCKYLGIREPGKGLIDYLDDPSIGLSSVMLRTNVPKLSILPAGRFHPHATELLASENMQSLMDDLSHRYPDRVVLFDSPPLLITSEAVALSELMGQLVLVVESGKTQQTVVKDALSKLNSDIVVGVLLNKMEGKGGPGYGGYYGYGGYGQGGGGV
jgi:protein-tyrosine kinase